MVTPDPVAAVVASIPETPYRCPACGKPAFVGHLVKGSKIKVRCRKTDCQYHVKGNPFAIIIM